MFEHVGPQQMSVYFRAMHRLLAPSGLFMNHGIVESPTRQAHGWRARLRRLLWRQGSFIDRDVFPDGQLVPLEFEIGQAEHVGFETRDVESLRPHYARTLREWVRRLDARGVEAARLTSEPTVRTWRLYMAASAHAFASAQIGLCQVLFAKPDAMGATPLPATRSDLYVAR
jgi:cyclopropane-fatty-acyl-phospholipid synthase